MRGQAFALLGIEYGVTLHEGDFALALLALVVGLGAGDAVGIDDELAALAFPHMAAELQRLFEGEPERGGVAFGHGCRPQHHDIDALIGNAVMAQGAGDAAGCMFGVPWLHPRAHALLKVGDDLAGDAAVNVANGVGHFSVSLWACEAAAAASCPSARPG